MRIKRTGAYGCLIPFLLFAVTACSTVTIRDVAQSGTVIALVSTKATVAEAEQVRDFAKKIEGVAVSGRATIESVYDEGVAEIGNDKLRAALKLLKPKLVDELIKFKQRNPLAKISVQVVEAAQGIQSGATIYITFKAD